jgi:hypothetical protein
MTTQAIFNGTSHAINFFHKSQVTFNSQLRKYILIDSNTQPYYTIQPGTNLNAYTSKLETNIESIVNVPFPCTGATVFTSYDSIPDASIVVCSQLYRSAVSSLNGNTSNLAIVSETVYLSATELRPIGCLSLAIG